MDDIIKTDWYRKFVAEHLSVYGIVPPPWMAIPNSHPFSIKWRTGYGKTLWMVFATWLWNTYPTEESRVMFFWDHPPPPRWHAHLAGFIWSDVDEGTVEGDDGDHHYDKAWYEKSSLPGKLKALGFKDTDKYVEDLDNPKWLKPDRP